jgi:hypothetical protein
MRAPYLSVHARIGAALLALAIPVASIVAVRAIFVWSSDTLIVMAAIGLPLAYGGAYVTGCSLVAAIVGVWPRRPGSPRTPDEDDAGPPLLGAARIV